MLGRADVLRHELEIRGAYTNGVEAHELSSESQDIGCRGCGREVVVGLPVPRRLLARLPRDDERLKIPLAKRWHRTERGLDAIRGAADADGDVVIANPGVASRVECRDEPGTGSGAQLAVAEAIS